MRKHLNSLTFTLTAAWLLSGCSKELPPRTAGELMQDDAVLQAVVTRCNQLGTAAARDAECLNAREAVDRLAAEKQAMDDAARRSIEEQEFERAREQRRAREALERRQQEEQQAVDPYTMPLVKDPEPAEQTTTPEPEAASPPP